MRLTLVCSRPAVSTSTRSASRLAAALIASNTTDPGRRPPGRARCSAPVTLGPVRELLGGGGAERVGGGEHDAVAVVDLALRDLGDGRGLPDAVDADEHPHVRLAGGRARACGRVALVEQRHQLGVQQRRCSSSASATPSPLGALAARRRGSRSVVGIPTSASSSVSSSSSHVSSSMRPVPAQRAGERGRGSCPAGPAAAAAPPTSASTLRLRGRPRRPAIASSGGRLDGRRGRRRARRARPGRRRALAGRAVDAVGALGATGQTEADAISSDREHEDEDDDRASRAIGAPRPDARSGRSGVLAVGVRPDGKRDAGVVERGLDARPQLALDPPLLLAAAVRTTTRITTRSGASDSTPSTLGLGEDDRRELRVVPRCASATSRITSVAAPMSAS